MTRNYFFIQGYVDEKAMLEDALQKTMDGDECTVHYHGNGQTCNSKCRKVVLPKIDEGNIL